MMLQKFNEIEVAVHPTNDQKEWWMTVEDAANGYGVGRDTIMKHLANHSDEIRDGIERGVTNIHTLGGHQKAVTIYKAGVVKLGFFIRSKNAAAFRQWATDLIVAVMDKQGIDMKELLARFDQQDKHIMGLRTEQDQRFNDIEKVLGTTQETQDQRFNDIEKVLGTTQETQDQRFNDIEKVCGGLRTELDQLKELVQFFMNDSEEEEIKKLILQIKQEKEMDGRAIVGHVKKTLQTHTIYGGPNTKQIINTLKNMLGKGLILLPTDKK